MSIKADLIEHLEWWVSHADLAVRTYLHSVDVYNDVPVRSDARIVAHLESQGFEREVIYTIFRRVEAMQNILITAKFGEKQFHLCRIIKIILDTSPRHLSDNFFKALAMQVPASQRFVNYSALAARIVEYGADEALIRDACRTANIVYPTSFLGIPPTSSTEMDIHSFTFTGPQHLEERFSGLVDARRIHFSSPAASSCPLADKASPIYD